MTMEDYSTQSLFSSSSSMSLEQPKTEKKDYGSVLTPRSERRQYRYIPVEVVSILFFTQTYIMLAHLQFYLHDRATREYDDTHPSNLTRDNSSDIQRENAIQAKATMDLIIIMVCTILPSALPVLFAGILSDSFGRKISMYLSIVGALVFCINVIVVVRFQSSVYILCFGGVVNGLCGYFGTIQTSVFSVVADITEPGSGRAWRMIILSVALSAGNFIGNTITGLWIDASGFLDILYLSTSLNVGALLITIFFIPETLPRKSGYIFSFKENVLILKDGFSFYFKDTVPNQRRMIWLCLVTFVVAFAVDIAKQIILGLYLLVRPFYWSPTHITLYIAGRTVLACIAVVVTTPCLSRVMSDIKMAILGTVSALLCLVITGASINDIMMYIGSMFCVVSLCEMLSATVLAATSGIIYQKTLVIFPGFVFIIMAILMLFHMIILMVLDRYARTVKSPRDKIYEKDIMLDS